VCECDAKDVPQFWHVSKSAQLKEPMNFAHNVEALNTDTFSPSFTQSMFAMDKKENPKQVDCPQNDKEWCVEDQDGQYSHVNEEDYILVNLLDNEETFTAYEGGPVWSTIYQENCVLDKAFSNLK